MCVGVGGFMFWQILPSTSIYVWLLEGFDFIYIIYIYIIYILYIYYTLYICVYIYIIYIYIYVYIIYIYIYMYIYIYTGRLREKEWERDVTESAFVTVSLSQISLEKSWETYLSHSMLKLKI